MPLGSANGLSHVTSSQICSNLRYGASVRWTSEAIRQRRDELRLTQQELADRLGVVLRTVTAWETGESRPRGTAKLDAVLGEPPIPLAARRLSNMGNAQLVAHVMSAISELASRLPQEAPRSESPRHAADAPDARTPVRTAGDERENGLSPTGERDHLNAQTG